MEVLAARLDALESESQLHRLASDYCVAADRRDRTRWAAVWTEDAVWQTGPEHIFTGLAEICGAVERQWLAIPRMQHSTTNHIVELDGDQANGRSDVIALIQLQDGRWVAGGASYLDEYRRIEGIWRIRRRRLDRPFALAPLAPSEGRIRVED